MVAGTGCNHGDSPEDAGDVDGAGVGPVMAFLGTALLMMGHYWAGDPGMADLEPA